MFIGFERNVRECAVKRERKRGCVSVTVGIKLVVN